MELKKLQQSLDQATRSPHLEAFKSKGLEVLFLTDPIDTFWLSSLDEFDGKKFSGYQGDTLASALLANGVQLMGRSFKYHRPRGPFTSGSEEPNAIVELREGARKEPNTRATMIELYDYLIAKSQNKECKNHRALG